MLGLLVKRLRKVWPGVRIVFVDGSSFCWWKTLRWCERHGVGYIVELTKIKRLKALSAML